MRIFCPATLSYLTEYWALSDLVCRLHRDCPARRHAAAVYLSVVHRPPRSGVSPYAASVCAEFSSRCRRWNRTRPYERCVRPERANPALGNPNSMPQIRTCSKSLVNPTRQWSIACAGLRRPRYCGECGSVSPALPGKRRMVKLGKQFFVMLTKGGTFTRRWRLRLRGREPLTVLPDRGGPWWRPEHARRGWPVWPPRDFW